jgi:hypothetical protein
MSIASIRRALRPFACDRHGDAAPGDNPPRQVIDARATWRGVVAAGSRR